jgi:hypothetical protein
MTELAVCPLCNRPSHFTSDHHLIPKCRGGKPQDTVLICQDCHDCIHALFSNKQLEEEFSSVEALLSNERFAGAVKFIAKQDPTRRMKTKRANDQKRRGRNG